MRRKIGFKCVYVCKYAVWIFKSVVFFFFFDTDFIFIILCSCCIKKSHKLILQLVYSDILVFFIFFLYCFTLKSFVLLLNFFYVIKVYLSSSFYKCFKFKWYCNGAEEVNLFVDFFFFSFHSNFYAIVGKGKSFTGLCALCSKK